MAYDIKTFQKRYTLSNKDMAEICGCSLPTIQKWRSGEVSVSGAAAQLMRLLDFNAEGNPRKLREVLGQLNQQLEPFFPASEPDLEELEDSMSKVVDRLELMLESRRKDKELADSEARYRSIVESSNNPICRWQPDTMLTYVNQAYANLFGDGDKEKLIGRRWLELIPEERRKSLEILVSDMVRRGEAEAMIHEAIGSHGELRFQEWRDFPVKNDKGEVLEFHSIGTDVTDLHTLRREVSELDKAKSVLLRYCNQPILIFNDAGDILEANEAFRHQVARDFRVERLSDLVSGIVAGKFKRLLKRMSGMDEICYRIYHEGRGLLFKVSLLARTEDRADYLAVIETMEEVENPVLNLRLRHEVVLEGVSHEFLIDPAALNRVKSLMNRLSRMVQVDRIYVFSINMEEEHFDNILEWCAHNIRPHIDDLKGIPNTDYPWWINRILKGQWIQIQDVSKLPRSAGIESDILNAQGITSIMAAPVVVDGKSVGFVGFDHTRGPRIWHEQERKALDNFKTAIEEILSGTLKQTAEVEA